MNNYLLKQAIKQVVAKGLSKTLSKAQRNQVLIQADKELPQMSAKEGEKWIARHQRKKRLKNTLRQGYAKTQMLAAKAHPIAAKWDDIDNVVQGVGGML